MSDPYPAARRIRRGLAHPSVCLWQGFRRHPAETWAALPTMRFSHRAWRRLSLRVHGRDFLADFYAAAAEAGIRPFLMWGTLLGCIREGGFLAHDEDIDLGILGPDFARRDVLIAAMERRGHFLRRLYDYRLSFWRSDRLVHIDVDVFFPWQGAMVMLDAEDDRHAHSHAFPAEAFAEMREAMIGGLPVLVPGGAEAVLAAVYGDWRTPRPAYSSSTGPLNRVDYAPGAPRPHLDTG